MEGSKTILVAIDFHGASLDALAVARELAGPLGLTVVLLHVCTIPVVVYPGFDPIVMPGLPEQLEAVAKNALNKVAAEHGGLPTLLRFGEPVVQIRDTIEETKPALVVLGTHGRKGLSHFFLGSVAERVVRESSSPVLTVHARADETPLSLGSRKDDATSSSKKTILVAVDFEGTSKRAVETAKWIAAAQKAEIVLLHVRDRLEFGHPQLPEETVQQIERTVEEARKKDLAELATTSGATRALFRHGDPADRILEAVTEIMPAMVVMGTHGRRGLGRMLVGSVAERVLRACPVPVITARAKPEDMA